MTESQRKAVKNYRKKVTKITIEFYLKDEEILRFLKSKDAVQTYIKGLIYQAYERERSF